MILFVLLVLVLAEPDVPSHACARACCCPCTEAQPCECDGRSCPVKVADPIKGQVIVTVDNARLPKWIVECPDRPLSKGRTYRPRSLAHHGIAWICNDPRCFSCCKDNEPFRQPPTEP